MLQISLCQFSFFYFLYFSLTCVLSFASFPPFFLLFPLTHSRWFFFLCFILSFCLPFFPSFLYYFFYSFLLSFAPSFPSYYYLSIHLSFHPFFTLLISFLFIPCLSSFKPDRDRKTEAERQTDKEAERHTKRQRQTEKQTERKTDRQTERQRARQTDKDRDLHWIFNKDIFRQKKQGFLLSHLNHLQQTNKHIQT